MNPNALENVPSGIIVAIVVFAILFLSGILIVYILYLKNLQKTLQFIREENRKMKPQKVWLLLITFLNVFFAAPQMIFTLQHWGTNSSGILLRVLSYATTLFALIWHFVIVTKISASIEAEYESRNMTTEPRPTYNTGLTMCICQTIATIFSQLPYLRILGFLISIVTLIFWILYWVKTNEYKNKLRALPPVGDEDSLIFKDLY